MIHINIYIGPAMHTLRAVFTTKFIRANTVFDSIRFRKKVASENKRATTKTLV